MKLRPRREDETPVEQVEDTIEHNLQIDPDFYDAGDKDAAARRKYMDEVIQLAVLGMGRPGATGATGATGTTGTTGSHAHGHTGVLGVTGATGVYDQWGSTGPPTGPPLRVPPAPVRVIEDDQSHLTPETIHKAMIRAVLMSHLIVLKPSHGVAAKCRCGGWKARPGDPFFYDDWASHVAEVLVKVP